jgi:Flp pilus assembly protein TadG
MSGRQLRGGQALVEFALIVPLFLVLIFAVFDFGRVIWANDAVGNAAREAARYAIVHGGSTSNTCPVGEPTPKLTVIPPASASCPYPSPSVQSIVDVANTFSVASGAPIVVEVCYGKGCTGSTNTPGSTNRRGTPVTVTVSSTVGILTGRLLGHESFAVSAKSTMLVNH